MLVDHKVVNQKTGKAVVQRPVRPDFDFEQIHKEITREAKAGSPTARADELVAQIGKTFAGEDGKRGIDGIIARLKANGTIEEVMNAANAEDSALPPRIGYFPWIRGTN